MDKLIEAIRDGLKRKGLSETAASRLAVGNPSAIKNLRVRRGASRSHPIENLIRVAGVLDLELYLGPPRNDAPRDQDSVERDFVPVHRYAVSLSAGPGLAGSQAEPLSPIAFRARWLSEQGLRADACCVVSISGDSMEPTLHDGDIVLVDCRPSQIRNGRVYAFVDASGDLKVKRLERLDGQLLLRSDNTDHQTEVRGPADTEQMKIIGPVRWSGHTW